MPKFPKSFGPFREKLKIRTNFRKLMRTVMLNNFKVMLFPKERRVFQGILSNFRGLVSKNRGPRRAQHRNITNKTPKEKGERRTRQRVPSARRFNLDFGFFPSVLQDPRWGFQSCQGRSWQGSPGTTAGLRSFRNRINLHRNRAFRLAFGNLLAPAHRPPGPLSTHKLDALFVPLVQSRPTFRKEGLPASLGSRPRRNHIEAHLGNQNLFQPQENIPKVNLEVDNPRHDNRAAGGIEQISRSLVLLHNTKSREVLGRNNVARGPTIDQPDITSRGFQSLANVAHITLFRKPSPERTHGLRG